MRLKLWDVKLIICTIHILRSNVEIFESYLTQLALTSSKTSILNSKFNFQNQNFNLSIMLYMTLSINMIWNIVYLCKRLDFGREFKTKQHAAISYAYRFRRLIPIKNAYALSAIHDYIRRWDVLRKRYMVQLDCLCVDPNKNI